MNNSKSPETPKLYKMVPTDPDRVRITIPLRGRILTEFTRDYLYGELSYDQMVKYRRDFYNPRLTTSSLAGDPREVWDTNHPSLQPKPKSKIDSL